MGKKSTNSPQAVETSKQYFAWLKELIARTDLNPIFKVVLARLALHRNPKSGRCDPSYLGLATECAVSERTAKRAIAEGEKVNILAVERSGGGDNDDRNRYTLLLPTGVQPGTPTGVQPDTLRTKPNLWAATLPREREVAAATPAGGPSSYRRPPLRKGKKKGKAAAGAGIDAALRADYAELHTAWPRPWSDNEDAALRAYAKARQYADRPTILAAAEAWVEAVKARNNGDASFLQPIEKWLNGRCWEKPPPIGKQANGHHHKGGRRRGNGAYRDEPSGDDILKERAIKRAKMAKEAGWRPQ